MNARLLSGLLILLATGATLRAEQTGTPRRVIAGDYDKDRLAIVSADGKVEWEEKIKDIHDLHILPNGNILFQRTWTHLVEMTPAHEVVWQYDAGKSNGNDGKKVEVHAFQRLADGVTMIAESGPGRIIEVDKNGKLLKEVKLKLATPDVHRDTRQVRKLDNGHYLVAHEGQNLVREYDDAGTVVWERAFPGARIFGVSRLPNGNTLVGGGDSHRVIEVDPAGKEVWSLNEKEIPGVTLAWVTMAERLPNGNTLVVNCHAGPENPQIIEVTPEKKLVWSFKDFEHFGNALPVARMMPDKP